MLAFHPLLVSFAGICLVSAQSSTSTTSSIAFQPTAGATWNIELQTPPQPSQANDSAYQIWDFDLFDASSSLISTFQSENHSVICYFSAGTYENWRPDANQFPKSALGTPLSHWAGERWLDTNNRTVRDIMSKRIELAQSKGCDAVDPDNIDAYDNGGGGFNLTQDDAVNYINFLSNVSHSLGMSISLKNGGGIVGCVLNVTDFSVQEQCVEYSECSLYQPFIEHNKPVFHIEYTGQDPASQSFVEKSCNGSDTSRFSTVIKHMDLNSWTTSCSGTAASVSGNSSGSSTSANASTSDGVATLPIARNSVTLSVGLIIVLFWCCIS